jgi:hypothetical protein
VNGVKIGILSVALSGPFGLAIYKDFIADPPPPTALERYADDYGLDLDRLDDAYDEAPDELDEILDEYEEEISMEQRLVSELGYEPTIVSADDLAAFSDIVTVRSGERASDGSAAGTFLTFGDGHDLHAELADSWDDARGYTDAEGITRYFWFNQDDQVRGMLESGLSQQRLSLRPYSPIVLMVDEAIASVGENVENLLVPDPSQNPLELSRPPSEFADAPTRLLVHHAKGVITDYRIEIDLLFAPDSWTEVLESMSADYGPATPTQDGPAVEYRFTDSETPLTMRRELIGGTRLVILVGAHASGKPKK